MKRKPNDNIEDALVVANILHALEPAENAPKGFPVDLSRVHAALRCEEPFPEWALNQVVDSIEGKDYIRTGENEAVFHATRAKAGEYASLDTTTAGRAWRQYLINAEKAVIPADTSNLSPEDEDRLRRVVGPGNVSFHNGMLMINPGGVRILCRRIIDGKENGDRDKAAAFLDWLRERGL